MKINKKYSKGQWDYFNQFVHVRGSHGIAQAILSQSDAPFRDRAAEAEANVRLIAAAPDLVDALIEIMAYLQETEWPLNGAAERAYNLGKGALIDAGIIDSEN